MSDVAKIKGAANKWGMAMSHVREMEALIEYRKANWASYEGTPVAIKDQEWLTTLKANVERFAPVVKSRNPIKTSKAKA